MLETSFFVHFTTSRVDNTIKGFTVVHPQHPTGGGGGGVGWGTDRKFERSGDAKAFRPSSCF